MSASPASWRCSGSKDPGELPAQRWIGLLKVDSLNDPITIFGCGDRPRESELVVWDGFDRLEKETAVQFFSEKTWRDVLSHLQGLKDEPVFGGAYFLEEWTVLSRAPLTYYGRAYLEYLRETLASLQPDEEFVFFFLASLCQVAEMGSPFDQDQTDLLRRTVQQTAELAAASGSFEYYAADIRQQAERFLTETAADDS